MFLLSAIGTAMVATSVIGIHRNMPNTHMKIVVRRYLEANKLEAIKISSLTREGDLFKMKLILPYNITAAEFQKHVPGIEQVTYSHIRFSYQGGPAVYLEFGYSEFKARMPFKMTKLDPLCIPLFSPFGIRHLDFRQETSCHVMIGGATRMGKTALIRLMATMLLHTTNGNVKMKMLDNKVNDLYMFKNIPQVEIGETADDAARILTDVLQEVADRKRVLKEYDDCIDIHELRQKHPDRDFPPLFIIIDEYGRYADDETVQQAVEALVETAGYLDVHIILASQRPDAQTVLKARIKANLTTRICFSTTDEANSKVVLDLPDAAKLYKVQGRAILLDGFPEVVQVPHLTTAAAVELLKPFVKEKVQDELTEGRKDYSNVEPLQSFEPLPIGEDSLPEPKKRNRNRKPGVKKT